MISKVTIDRDASSSAVNDTMQDMSLWYDGWSVREMVTGADGARSRWMTSPQLADRTMVGVRVGAVVVVVSDSSCGSANSVAVTVGR